MLTHCSWHKTSSPFSAAPCHGLSYSIKEEGTWDPGYLIGSKFTFLRQSSIDNSHAEERSSPGLHPHRSCERGFQQQRRLLLFLQVHSWLSSFWGLVPNTAALHLLQPKRGFLQKACAPDLPLLKASYCQCCRWMVCSP